MSEWRKLPLKEITVKIGSGSTPTGGSGAYKETGVSLIRSQNVLDFSFTNNGLAFIDEEQAHALRNVIVEPQDVLLNITGDSVARCCSAPREWLPARVNQHVAIIRAHPKHLDSLFLKYSLISIKDELLSLSEIGGTRNALTKSMLENLKLFVPSVIEQKAIASVLSSLDDKIDLLHRQNKTLESMAETLFRQWFDVDSNDEWQEKNVLDIFTLVGGGTPKTSVAEYWTDEIPWISGGDISAAHQGYLYSTEKSISLAGLQNSSAKLLPKNSTVISARGTVGKYALLARDMAFSQSNYGIVSKIGSYPFFIYLLVGFIVDDLLTAAYGSVFDTITTRTFESVNLKFPSLNSIEKFNEEISPIFSKKETNTQQIKTLENLRDTLLPKLMNGEVRVQYAEEAIASVA
ncbi:MULTISPECIES: restriction endonuclease subunit S [Enterobacteriaceae]|uniref:Type I restriction-modification system, S subunit n=1 Tax=Escherichia coli TaxID=562 RepID=A0A2X7GWQ7_ECOLX|nr:restriction endonuclease subunit S [Escherichia coli]MCZ5376844.1 restriction endonuclease subunit S [Escherichia coli]MDC7883933.1 restriction endonuclease subunit S [Escherichia coli]MHN64771.1 restriction endonuclease subunit S [Escherichia coli]MHU13883.1 restriction endonuclease subunit S [Escherichia coli]SQP84380.1 type I restriction-modification system, S subunit [Escherichia coli]